MEQQLISEMQQVGGFLQSRLSSSGSEHVNAIAHKLAQSMVKQVIKLSTMTSDTAHQLTAALASSAYAAEGKAAILAAIEAGLGRDSCDNATANKWAYQYLHANMVNYLTQMDWDGLNSQTKPIANKLQLVVDSYISSGLQHPDEWILAWLLAAVALCRFRTWPKYKALYAMVQDLQESFKSSN